MHELPETEEGVMSKNTLIYLRVGEGKSLPAKDISGKSDPYCLIKVDNDVVGRTATVWRNLNPFWGEEYTMFVPEGFTNISIIAFDEDTIGEDERIGKITFTSEVLTHSPRGMEKWFPLLPVYDDDDIQGELRIETSVFEKCNETIIKAKVLGARDLPEQIFYDSAGPFIRLTLANKQREMLNGESAKHNIIQHTKEGPINQVQLVKSERDVRTVHKSISFPNKYQTFELHSMSNIGDLKLVASVMDKRDENRCMAEAIVFLSKHNVGQTKDGWYKLIPQAQQFHKKPENLGSIRLKISLMEEYVLPSVSYKPLTDLIMQPVLEYQPSNSVDALSIIADMATIDHACVARNLVKVFLGNNMLLKFLDWITSKEMKQTTSITTLFRGNSLASKAVEQFMKVVGMPYLCSVLKPTIDTIFDEHKICELDPNRLEKAKSSGMRRRSLLPFEDDTIGRSAASLGGYVDSIMEAILTSMQSCPILMRLFFRNLAKRAYEHFGEDYEQIKYHAISGFFFLRFFAPAILGPKLFSLRDNHADSVTSRTLTLLAKIIQKISNLHSQENARNEEWITPLCTKIESYSERLRDFFDKIMDVEDSEAPGIGKRRSVFDQSVVIKEGFLKKCRFKVVKLPKSYVFKKRYCWLSTENFLYSHSPTAETRHFLPTHKIVAVEKVDECAFQKPNVLQLISEEYEGALQTLYLSCQNVNEMNQWMSAIRKTIVNNPRVLTMFHSGLYNHKWKCCGKPSRACGGCTRSGSKVILSDWRDPLDPDAEIQMVYTQLFLSRNELKQKYLEGSTREDDEGDCMPSDKVRTTVASLLDIIDDLYESHRAFEKKLANKAKLTKP